MSDTLSFEPPVITDEEIRWATRLLELPANAFNGVYPVRTKWTTFTHLLRDGLVLEVGT
jgi:hypothetical protein